MARAAARAIAAGRASQARGARKRAGNAGPFSCNVTRYFYYFLASLLASAGAGAMAPGAGAGVASGAAIGAGAGAAGGGGGGGGAGLSQAARAATDREAAMSNFFTVYPFYSNLTLIADRNTWRVERRVMHRLRPSPNDDLKPPGRGV